jgi:hypothetical protein
VDNGIVSLWSLPGDKVYLELKSDFKERIFNLTKEHAGSWHNLGKQLNLPINKYGNCKLLESARNKRFSLALLSKLIDYLDLNGEEIDKAAVEKEIIALSSRRGGSNSKTNSIYNPKLPFNFNTVDGATVISSVFHDGGINSNKLPHYSNPDNLELRQRVYEAFKNVFGDFTSRKSNPSENQQLYFPKIVGIVLIYGLGIPFGRRTINNPSIPNFLFNAQDTVRASFIRQAFDDESHVHKTQRNISLKLSSGTKNPSNLMVNDKAILEGLGIEAGGPHYIDCYDTKDGNRNYRWSILISHQDNLKRFYEIVGFQSTYKQKRLQEIVNTLKRYSYPTRRASKIYQCACRNLQKRYGFITSRELSMELGRSQELSKKVIQKLVRTNILSVKECRHGNRGAKYILSDNS